jgi:hypothetical protein
MGGSFCAWQQAQMKKRASSLNDGQKLTKVVQTLSKGRCLVAKKIIKTGTVIIREIPTACIPHAGSTLAGLNTTKGAYMLTEIEKNLQTTASNKGYRGFHSAILGARLLIACQQSRCHHNNTDPQTLLLNQLMRTRNTDLIWQEGLQANAEIVYRLVHFAGFQSSLQQCVDVLEAIASNAFTITDDNFITCGIGIFAYASCINHSCLPNCLQRFTSEVELEVISLTDIAVGEELTICYVDLGYPTWRKQAELRSYGFLCQCLRCSAESSREGYKCGNSRCPGLCVPNAEYYIERYQHWLKGIPMGSSVDMKGLRQQQKALLSLQLPFAPLLLPLVSNQPSDRQQPQQRWALECNVCKKARSLSALLRDIRTILALYQELECCPEVIQTSDTRLTVSAKLLRCVEMWLPKGQYFHQHVFQLYIQAMGVDLHSSQSATSNKVLPEEYLNSLKTYIQSKSLCYALRHALHPTIFQLLFNYTAHLLSNQVTVRDKKEVHRISKQWRAILPAMQRIYGSKHPLYEQACRGFQELICHN